MNLRIPSFAWIAACLVAGCNSQPDTDEHEQKVHTGVKPKSALVKSSTYLRDTLQLLVQQLDTVRRVGCWDEDFASLMRVHHTGAQRLAAIEISQGQDSTLRQLAQHVLKGHERDNQVFMLALRREPPKGQEYRPGNTKNPFVRRVTAALAPLQQLPALPGSIDTDFATLMQIHHRSGVALAQTELAFGRNPELKAAARRIVQDQRTEIKQYQRWMRTHSEPATK